jgi:DNA-binding PadR family transcriptional regulator
MSDFDFDKIDEVVLALMQLTLHDEYRAWKGFDWDVLNRLYEKGLIDNPVGKAKSVALTEEGLKESARLFEKHFGITKEG